MVDFCQTTPGGEADWRVVMGLTGLGKMILRIARRPASSASPASTRRILQHERRFLLFAPRVREQVVCRRELGLSHTRECGGSFSGNADG